MRLFRRHCAPVTGTPILRTPLFRIPPFVVPAFVILLQFAGACVQPPATPPLPVGHGRVVEVADGDTITVDFGTSTEVVRLIGLDTPEVGHHDTEVECFGPEASAATKALLPPGTEVRLTRDDEPRDIYGRLLAYVWRTSDDLLVNHQLVAGGYADVLDIAPNLTHSDAIHAARRQARADKLGLWGACDTLAK